ncbi:MAG: alpha-amylase family glycosyl hydrolase, partial [Armatimonadota bacterium]
GVSCAHEVRILDRASEGYRLDYGTQYLQVVSGDYGAGLEAARRTFRFAGLSFPSDRPRWATRAAMYSLHGAGTIESGLRDLGGLKEVQRLLPVWRDMGIDTVWLLPYCPGCYAPLDYYEIDPRIGTAQDLKDTIARAHELGMRFLLDLIPHGPRETCDVAKQHPEWINLGEDGSRVYRWGCVNMDSNNPGWQQYMADVATHFVREYGADGWRVDVAAGNEPNWAPDRKVRPSQARPYGGMALLAKVRAEMKKVKPDSILFPEATGPHMFESGDLVYDYPFFNDVLSRFHEESSPAEWRRKASEWLELQKYSFPEGATAGLVRFLENHDQVRSVKYWGVGVARALMAICVLSEGVPLIYHNQEVGLAPYYRRLLTIRRAIPELTEGEAFYTAVECSDPNVFTCLRSDGERKTLVAVNLAGSSGGGLLTLPEEHFGEAPGRRLEMYDVLKGRRLQPTGNTLRLGLAPYSTAVVVVRPRGQAIPLAGASAQSPAEPSRLRGSAPAVKMARDGTVTVSNGVYEATFSGERGGLMSSLRLLDGSGRQLVRACEVGEGVRKIWGDGPPARLSRTATRAPEVRSMGETTRIGFSGAIVKGPVGRETTCAEYRIEYRCDASNRMRVTFEIRPRAPIAGMNGEFFNSVTLGDMTNWFVETCEGPLHDDFVVRTTGERIASWMYWHPVGDRLWESRTQPLDPGHPLLGAYNQDTGEFIVLEHPRCSLPGSFENVYLTDVTEADRRLRFVLGVFDRRNRIPAEADGGFRWSYYLTVGRGGRAEAERTVPMRVWDQRDVPRLRVCGSAYMVENKHYRAVIAKSGGGTIRRLILKDAADAVVLSGTDVYTDHGIYPKESKEGGYLGLAAARGDIEPDVSICGYGTKRLTLSFFSLLRNSYRRWGHYARPSIQYRQTYEFGDSPDIKATIQIRPLLALKDTPVFLSWVAHFEDTTRWFASSPDGWQDGPTSQDVKRVWEAKRRGLQPGEAVVGVANDDGNWFVAFTDVRSDAAMENAPFSHVS